MPTLAQRILAGEEVSIEDLENSKEPAVFEALEVCRDLRSLSEASLGAKVVYHHIRGKFPKKTVKG